MLLSLLNSFGLRNQGLLLISPDEFSLTDIKTQKVDIHPRKSKHPRSIVGDFFEVEKELSSIMDASFPRRWCFTELVICVRGLDHGGYTKIEIRAISELGYGSGAHKVHISTHSLNALQAKQIFKGESREYVIQDM